MNWSEVLTEAALRMAASPPDAVTDALRTVLRTADPDADCRLWLVDYRLVELRALGRPDLPALPVDGSVHGRVFAAQRPARLDGDRPVLVVPVSAHGDRLGVLAITLSRRTTPAGGAADGGGVADGGRAADAGRAADGGGVADGGGIADGGEAELVAAAGVGELLGQAVRVADQGTDVYRSTRRDRSLTLAAELQWDLIPGGCLRTGFATVAGQLEPAYTVAGDGYDWTAGPDELRAVIVDGAGHGTHASVNAGFALAAMRNARREGADLEGMARLADQALHARYGGSLFCSGVLVGLKDDGGLAVIVAGAGRVLVAGPGGGRRLRVERQPPLGAEEDPPYRAETFRLAPGERLVLVSDGLVDAQSSDVRFGAGLERLVHGYRLLDPAELVRALVRDLRTFHAGRPQQDDAVALCLSLRH